MATKQFQTQLAVGDGRSFALEVLRGGALQNLNGYTVTLTIKAGSATAITASTTVSGDATEAVVELTSDKTTIAGYYEASLTAAKTASPGPWTALGVVEILAKPA